LFGKQTSHDILQDAAGGGFPAPVQVWGWGCNSRGQLGPLAPSASVLVQPQCLHVMKDGQRLDSISARARVFARNVNSLRCCFSRWAAPLCHILMGNQGGGRMLQAKGYRRNSVLVFHPVSLSF
jgi:hypothetical protein